MAADIPWVSEDKQTGRLFFRRRYPDDVKGALGWEKKVTLGAKWRMNKAASVIYYRACDAFEREVAQARAAARVGAKKAAADFDRLTRDQIDYLSALLVHDRRVGMDQRVQEGHARTLGELWGHLLPIIRNARVDGDAAILEEIFGPTADDLVASEGLHLDPADVAGRAALIWALSGRIVEEGDNFSKVAEGFAPPLPPKPPAPKNPKGRGKTVAALTSAYKLAKWDGWSESSRTAIAAPFRLLEDMIGSVPVVDIDRDVAREVFDAVKMLPAAMGRHKPLKGLSVPEAIARGKEMGLPTIGPKTVNGSYMAHISAAFGWAETEQWISWNPFKKLTAADPVADEDKRDAFSDEQLGSLFSAAPWDDRAHYDDRKPGRYWVPLIALYTGMRLGEIAGLRVMDADKIDGVPCLRVRPYEGRSIKTRESRRDVPIPKTLRDLGLLSFIQYRRGLVERTALLFPDGKANVRRQWGAKLGEWFVSHLKEREIFGTKLGMHSFRHNFEDRLKAAGVSGSAEALVVSGRSISGSQSIYGTVQATGRGFPIASLERVLDQIVFPNLNLAHLYPEARSPEK